LLQDVLNVHTLKCAGITVKEPLLDIFSGVKVYLVPGTARAGELQRYFIAYDGEVVEEYQKSLATYFISDSTSAPTIPSGSSAKCLRADWIWDSLKEKQQLPVEKYFF